MEKENNIWTITSELRGNIYIAFLAIKDKGIYTFTGKSRMESISKALQFKFGV